MREYIELLERIGVEEKASRVYLALLSLGPSPVRKIAVKAEINRGTTHQLLRALIEQGLVSFYHKSKRQYFVAEAPEKLVSLSGQRMEDMRRAHAQLTNALDGLRALPSGGSSGSIVRSYEGRQGVRTVLEEVLEVMSHEQEKLYRVYSSTTIRDAMYNSFKNFTQERIARGIQVRVIAIGAGGEHQELAQRRWLSTTQRAPTYHLIYRDRMAVLTKSANEKELRAVVIQDEGIYQTEVLIFDALWKSLQQQSLS